MKKKIAILISAVFVLSVFSSGVYVLNKTKLDYSIDYGSSELYTEKDMQSALKLIDKEFLKMDDVKTVIKVAFAGDERCLSEAQYYSQHNDYNEFIVFNSSFLTKSNTMIMNPNKVCYGWSFIFGRNTGESWQYITCGYA